MADESKTLLEREIEDRIENLKSQVPGAPEDSEAVENLRKLHTMRIEEIKLEMEGKTKAKESKADRIYQWAKLGVDVAGIGLPLIFYGIWMDRGFKFEKDGTFTSTTFRGLFNRFRPTGR